MKTRAAILSSALLFLVYVTPLVAHHNVLAIFDPNKELTITGTVTQITWLNPHALLFIEVKGADGKVVTWQVELAPPHALTRKGFQKDTVPVSSSVTVRMWPARDGSHLATIRMLALPDGKEFETGDSLGWQQIR